MLKRAANFFARTPLYGWNGGAFVDTRVRGSLQPYDRFISEREFGLKRRMLLVNPDTPIPAGITVLRMGPTGPIYLLGQVNQDIFGTDAYSLVYLVCVSWETCEIVALEKTPVASGLAYQTTDETVGTYHCSSERVTFVNAPEFTQVRYTDATITLPLDCPVHSDHEVLLGDARYVVQETYTTAGFKQARCLVKHVQ